MTDLLPRVTGILKSAGLVDTTWFKQEDLDRGTQVHLACQFYDENVLIWDSLKDLDPRVTLRLTQYQRFLEELKPEILAIEEEVTNEALRYIGHLDRRWILNGSEGIGDLKAPSKAPWQAIQLALYAGCFKRPMKRWTLHLHDDRYQLIEHKNRKDWEIAKAAITIANWREANV